MRYYCTKKRPEVDYTKGEYQPCWTCAKACGGCIWSRYGKPIPGWKANDSFIPSNGDYAKTYEIIYCPEYVKEERK